MLIIDKYAYNNRLVGVDPLKKILFSLGILIVAISTKRVGIHIVIVVMMGYLTVFKARIPFGSYLKMMMWPISFLLISMISIVISVGAYDGSGRDSFLFFLEFGKFVAGVTREGMRQAAVLFFRSNAAVSAMFFLSLTTPVDQQARALYRLKINKVFIELYLLTYRFIAIFLEESVELYQAESMRFGYIDFRTSMTSLAMLVKLLFVRVMARYEDMQASLAIKLFDGTFYYGGEEGGKTSCWR